MRNCPQCGAPIEPYKNKCGYCGVYYWDFSAFDCTKKCYVKFKTIINGQECVVTALANPKLEEAIVSSETNDLCDEHGVILSRFVSEKTCELKATFSCEVDPEKKSLFQIEIPAPQN